METTLRSPARAWRTVAIAVVCCLVAAPSAVLLAKALCNLPDNAKIAGDGALIELCTLRAAAGDQLLGPYSRFSFHHPGPLMFYCLAPFYVALGKSYGALCTGALVLNLASLVGIALVTRDMAGAGRWPWSLAALGVYVLWLQPVFLFSPWNPDMAILPLALALLAFAAAAAGRRPYLPVAVLAASFAVQSHLSCAGPVACAVVLNVVAGIARRRKRGETAASGAQPARPYVAIAATLAVFVWIPPFLEQVRGTPGNMTLIWRFLAERHERQPLVSALLAVGTQLSSFLGAPFGLGSQHEPSPAFTPVLCVLAGVLLALLGAASLRGRRRGDGFVLALGVGCVVLLAVALLETAAVPGRLHGYLVRWVSVVGLLGAIAAAVALPPSAADSSRAGRWGLWACALVVAATTAVGLRSVIRFPATVELVRSGWLDRVSDATVSVLTVRGVRHPHVRILSHRSWEQAAGLVLQCTKVARPPSVDDWWLFMFGESCRIREADDGAVLVGDRATAARLAAMRGVEPVVAAGEDSALFASVDRPVDGELRFGELESDLYVRSGFSGPENEPAGGFRWSDGRESVLVLPAAPGAPHRLRFEASPITVPGAKQDLTVEVNGQRIAVVGMEPSWVHYAFAVPADLIRARNLVRFRYSLVRSPFELAGTMDMRRLAVRFRTISLARAASP